MIDWICYDRWPGPHAEDTNLSDRHFRMSFHEASRYDDNTLLGIVWSNLKVRHNEVVTRQDVHAEQYIEWVVRPAGRPGRGWTD